MSDDLPERLLAAIEKREQAQRLILIGDREDQKPAARDLLRHCAADRKIVELFLSMNRVAEHPPVGDWLRVRVEFAAAACEMALEALAGSYGLPVPVGSA